MPTLFVDNRAPHDILSDAASYRIRALLQNLSMCGSVESAIMKSWMELTIE
jgi:hypothetical protein